LPSLLWPGPLQWGVALFVASAVAFWTLVLADAVFGSVFAALVLWLTKSDLERFQLPDFANSAVAGAGLAWLSTLDSPEPGLLHAALRAVTTAALLAAVNWAYARLRGHDGLGWGDVKLAAAGAIWLEWSQLPMALLIAAAAGILAFAAQATLSRTPIRAVSVIPFGAFLAPAMWLVWFVGRAGLS
jgi:leader peptidase (prepilin peptidase) / N-methyltransferase